jgi:hypothetical protein
VLQREGVLQTRPRIKTASVISAVKLKKIVKRPKEADFIKFIRHKIFVVP